MGDRVRLSPVSCNADSYACIIEISIAAEEITLQILQQCWHLKFVPLVLHCHSHQGDL